VVEPVLEGEGLGSLLLGVLAGVLDLGLLDESLLLLFFVLGSVLGEKLEELVGYNYILDIKSKHAKTYTGFCPQCGQTG
jgi:hypothetical protein